VNPQLIIVLFFIIFILIGVGIYIKTFKTYDTLPEILLHNLLIENVYFYTTLHPKSKQIFRQRVNNFISKTKISRADKHPVADLDKALIGASAIIPIFNFPNWEYHNLSEVIIYNDSFNFQFNTTGDGRNILGMVGEGPLKDTLLISKKALREGFKEGSNLNTAIHEFVHLIDMSDGHADGIPENLIPKDLIAPWIQIIYNSIHQIKNNELPIRQYATTNKAEFFSVISEYFFLKPELLQKETPDLYKILKRIYKIR
jgi:Mlc titration factor MtfA (ptsG expression regulator)